ncbi:MAG: hypothetical protein KIT10_04670 [Flavobacteriales bacterium]|nr:hypothetical protein [Flavobacteriales bacterium]
MEYNQIAQRKPLYPVGEELRRFLEDHGRETGLPIAYRDLLRYDSLLPTTDAQGRATLWNTVLLRPDEMQDTHRRLVETYQALIAGGRRISHLAVASVDFCPFGNSQPFRVKIINLINDNHDYFYVKRTDASRIYGLELEHYLSPNRIQYLRDGDTLVEEHIIGVPGDAFIAEPQRYGGALNEVRLSKEFVKFNERCCARLLGDMRAYNFVVDVIHDLDQVQYRLRCIDFDQQCYEGRLRIYLPQFYKENLPYVRMAERVIGAETALQYRNEERALLRRRYALAHEEVDRLLDVLDRDVVSSAEHVRQLAEELAHHHGEPAFQKAASMGGILKRHLDLCLRSLS